MHNILQMAQSSRLVFEALRAQIAPVLADRCATRDVDMASELHAAGISLCLDLVLNHTAKEHEWAQRAMAGEAEYLDYYYTFTDRTHPDAYERTLPEIFPDSAPGNFSWYPEMAGTGRWVWTTFNEFQWDLNYTNPAVFREIADTMFFLANQGVDILRLDAAPFIWKRIGTNCQNQPEVFLLIQAFRAVTRIVAPAVIFKAEAIGSRDSLIPYLGVKTTTGKECELAYNNELMVLLWSTLATRKVTLLTYVLDRMPRLLLDSTWITYVRNHDDIGWAITEEDAAAVGENGFLHRQFLSEFYSGNFPESFAKGALFQYNLLNHDARIGGTTASLTGLEQAVANQDDRAIELAVNRILLLYSVIMVYGGIPMIHMEDELGLFNDRAYSIYPVKAADNRWMHRPPMDWTKVASRHNPDTCFPFCFSSEPHLTAIYTNFFNLSLAFYLRKIVPLNYSFLGTSRYRHSSMFLNIFCRIIIGYICTCS